MKKYILPIFFAGLATLVGCSKLVNIKPNIVLSDSSQYFTQADSTELIDEWRFVELDYGFGTVAYKDNKPIGASLNYGDSRVGIAVDLNKDGFFDAINKDPSYSISISYLEQALKTIINRAEISPDRIDKNGQIIFPKKERDPM
jgi:hypothetical protein